MVKVVVVLRNEIREDFDVEVETKVEVKKGLVQADDAMDALSLSTQHQCCTCIKGSSLYRIESQQKQAIYGGTFLHSVWINPKF